MRIVLILLIACSFACKSKKEVTEKNAPLVEQPIEQVEEKLQEAEVEGEKQNIAFPSNAVARIQRTACFGRCPIYILTVYEDGRVLYEAQKWVENEGTFQAKTDPSKFKQLLSRAEEINYFALKNKYDSEYVTDIPSTITTLRKDDELKQIVNRYEGPDELRDFEKYFDSLYLQLEWSKQDSE